MDMRWKIVGTKPDGSMETVLTDARETADFLAQWFWERGCTVDVAEMPARPVEEA